MTFKKVRNSIFTHSLKSRHGFWISAYAEMSSGETFIDRTWNDHVLLNVLTDRACPWNMLALFVAFGAGNI